MVGFALSYSQPATPVANSKGITLAKRTRYQYGGVEINKRGTGPNEWIYRWWETTSKARKRRRGFTVGAVEKYKTEVYAHLFTSTMKPRSGGTSSSEYSLFNVLSRLPTADRLIRTVERLKSKSDQRNPRISETLFPVSSPEGKGHFLSLRTAPLDGPSARCCGTRHAYRNDVGIWC